MEQLRKWVREDYKECILLMEMPEALKAALRVHERVPKFVDNLSAELNRCGHLWRHKPNEVIRKQVKEVVYSFTETFINSVRAKSDEDFRKQMEAQKPQAPDPDQALNASGNGTVDIEGFEVRVQDAGET